MRRNAPLLLATTLLVPGLLALCACSGNKNAEAPPPSEATQGAGPGAGGSGAVVESEFGTPVKDRVATLGFLNKRNNITQVIQLKTGESRRIGNVIIKLATCERTAPKQARSSSCSSRSARQRRKSLPGTRCSRAGCSRTRPRSTWSSTRSMMCGSRTAR